MCLNVCRPDTHIDVRDLKQELDVITLSSCKNDANTLISKMLRTYQDIHARTGRASYTARRFTTNLIRASESCLIKPFVSYVTLLKQQWINDDITDEYAIAKKLIKMAKNLVADKKWVIDTTKETKMIALTTEVQTLKEEIASLKSSAPPTPQTPPRNPAAGTNTTLSKVPPEDLWAVTYVGDTTMHNSRKYVWCDKHKSRDGSISGRYMPFPHDHDDWAARKAARNEKRIAEQQSPGAAAAPKEAKKLRLALTTKLATTLVSKYGMAKDEADQLVSDTCNEASQAP